MQDIEARLAHAAAALQRRDLDGAAQQLICVLAAAPEHPAALHMMALLQRERGQLPEALENLSRALRVLPRDPQLHATCANLLRESHRPEQAMVHYRRALELDPHHPGALYNLATLHLSRELPAAAVPLLLRLSEIQPEDPEAWNILGLALTDDGQMESAIEALERAVTLAPKWSAAHSNLGVALGYAGHGAKARQAWQQALALDPAYVPAYEHLLRSARTTEADRPLLDRVNMLLGEIPADSDGALALHFALAKALEDLGDYEQAFAHARQGNQLMGQRLTFDAPAMDALVSAVLDEQDRAFFDARPRHGLDSAVPVFVLGMPRSGSSLVERLLASHSAVHGCGELQLVPDAASALCADGGGFPTGLAAAGAQQVAAMAGELLGQLRARSPRAERIVDKLPGNYLFLGVIRVLFPHAAIIHCRRDPMDTCASIYFQRFAHGHPYANDLDQIAAVYTHYHHLMAHWHRLFPGWVLDVDYEAMVAAPEAQTRRMLAHLGLEWEDEMLQRVGQGVVSTASSHQVREEIHTRSVSRWTRYASHLQGLQQRLAGLNSSSDGEI